jgi:hypothetical protein
MTIIANKKMQDLVSEEQLAILQNQSISCVELDLLLESPIVEREDCFFIKALYGEDVSHGSLLEQLGKTGLECFINHAHAEDFIKAPPNKVI